MKTYTAAEIGRAKNGRRGAKKLGHKPRAAKEPTLRLGAINVFVKHAGEGHPPWAAKFSSADEVFRYKVVVSGPGARYATHAWGSIHDHQLGKHNDASIGAMVVEELLSANADPDEFMSMVIGESPGMEALKRAKIAEKVIKAAKKFGYDVLSKAVEDAEAKGLR